MLVSSRNKDSRKDVKYRGSLVWIRRFPPKEKVESSNLSRGAHFYFSGGGFLFYKTEPSRAIKKNLGILVRILTSINGLKSILNAPADQQKAL